jgi:putative flippase GtrA
VSNLTLALHYGAFALLATTANLGTQSAILAIDDKAVVYYLALAAGTGIGLVVKYILDKRWIFADSSTGVAAHAQRFSLYTLMGVFTTLIFWGTETLFWFTWHSHEARVTGALLGLGIGYFVKYQLDRRFVFSSDAPAAPAFAVAAVPPA